jgi:hypothetical protein
VTSEHREVDPRSHPTGPKVTAGGLVTVAFLKARLDAGEDHLGIFMPLVLDVLPKLENRHFTASDVQQVLAEVHGVTMPHEAVGTLLRRAARKHVLVREAGLFHVNGEATIPRSNVSGEKDRIGDGQLRLGEALRGHAAKRGLSLESSRDALDLLLCFLEKEQVGLLLGAASSSSCGIGVSQRESVIVAEFLHDVVDADQALRVVLSSVLEGLVLYHAAFLPDLSDVDRKFHDLKVYVDSVLVRQALGYEGEGARVLMRDTIDLLRRSGVQCVVFDKTVQEIHRILAMYESNLATPTGRRRLRQVPMARHFLTMRYTPSDVQEMSALLETDVTAVGLLVQATPPRAAKYTADENALAERLADSRTHDKMEPRVTHDVDCAAAVLTMRRGRRSHRIEDAGAVFVTSSTLVITNTRLWWEEDEHEAGVPPVIHIRSLANLAWLKRPTFSAEFQILELVALCSAAMRPSQRTWRRFLDHLDSLQASQRLSQDEATAIIVSAVSDRLLWEAELDSDDPDDFDAETLDEVVERVMAHYGEDAEKRVRQASRKHEHEMAETRQTAEAETASAQARERFAAERLRRREMAIDGRARKWAKRGVRGVFWAALVIVVAGEFALAASFPFPHGWIGSGVGFAVVAATLLAVAAAVRHISDLRVRAEEVAYMRLRDWLRGDDVDCSEPDDQALHRSP